MKWETYSRLTPEQREEWNFRYADKKRIFSFDMFNFPFFLIISSMLFIPYDVSFSYTLSILAKFFSCSLFVVWVLDFVLKRIRNSKERKWLEKVLPQ